MNMLAAAKPADGKLKYECLRCGHVETRKVQD
jgi:hypothetical protein